MEDHLKHFNGNVAQKAIIEKDGKILVCRGVGDAVWEFPGGRLHDGETPVEGIKREIKEELGVEVTDVRPFQIERNYHFRTKVHQVFIVYTCTMAGADIKVDSSELEEIRWVSKDELKTLSMFDDGGTLQVRDAWANKIV
ncbi:MAG: NUDIX domain-containing protein [Candidatus Pacebacteria bacterium]|nr:NUDIX domain-containing protein [Candidatus Paceibacterota bacterium]